MGRGQIKIAVGQRYGRLEVLRRLESNKYRVSQWEMKCDCGKITISTSQVLTKGEKRSCGCLYRETIRRSGAKNLRDLSGQRYGRLVVISRSPNQRPYKTQWICQCDCGITKSIVGGNLRSGHSRSCGCIKQEQRFRHGLSNTKEYDVFVVQKRNAAKLQRTPPWADLDAILQIYSNRPDGYEVDHIIPLQGELVSGLHVPSNLQYLTKSENSTKHCRFTPQIIQIGSSQTLPNVYW
jgi:hypothetical protein